MFWRERSTCINGNQCLVSVCQLAYAVVADDHGGTIVHLRGEKERVRARKFSAGVRRASTNSES